MNTPAPKDLVELARGPATRPAGGRKIDEKLEELMVSARRRRAYVHALAMNYFTPKQYRYAVAWLTKRGYGPNVFPIHHIHPPLSMAVLNNNREAIQALLDGGADPHLSYPTEKGRTSPLQMAIDKLGKLKTPFTQREYVKAQGYILEMLVAGAQLDKPLRPTDPETFRDRLTRIDPDLAAEWKQQGF